MTVRIIGAPAPSAEPYRVIVADPPWTFRDQLPGGGRGARKHYATMTTPEISRFLPDLEASGQLRIASKAILFLWRVSALTEDANVVIKAWNFVPKSEIVWLKKALNGKLAMGMGHYVRGAHETCVIAARGVPSRKDAGVRSVFEAIRRDHSTKPEEFFAIVERLYDGPFIELFARKTRPGWDAIGNELVKEATS